MRLQLYPHSSKRFTFTKSGTFVSEASDLNNRHLERIYDDACDVGLMIVSSKTGWAVTYYMDKEHRRDDEDNEITHWTYLPTSKSLREVPACKGTSVTVFND